MADDANGGGDVSVFFTDGYVVSKNYLLIAAKLNALPDEYFSRCFYLRNDAWIHGDITDAVLSVGYDMGTDEAIWLGQSGSITYTRPGSRRTEVLPDVERLGNLNRIRNISDAFYTCGYGGQVYRRTQTGWVHMDSGSLVQKPDVMSLDLKDIDGTAPDNIYAVGTGGAICHFDGFRWSRLDSPTNAHLTGVKCVHDEVYVCGFRGTLLRGNRAGWEFLAADEETSNFYCIEYFSGDVYLSTATKLLKLVADHLSKVNIGINSTLTFHRLHANDGVLWSFGTDHLIYFDGLQWREVQHPDNP